MIKAITPITNHVKRNERYAEHEWHKQLIEKQTTQAQAQREIADLRKRGIIINVLV